MLGKTVQVLATKSSSSNPPDPFPPLRKPRNKAARRGGLRRKEPWHPSVPAGPRAGRKPPGAALLPLPSGAAPKRLGARAGNQSNATAVPKRKYLLGGGSAWLRPSRLAAKNSDVPGCAGTPTSIPVGVSGAESAEEPRGGRRRELISAAALFTRGGLMHVSLRSAPGPGNGQERSRSENKWSWFP